MIKKEIGKYPTLRVRVTQDQFDKAYRTGWPKSVKEFINNIKENENDKKATNGKATNNQ